MAHDGDDSIRRSAIRVEVIHEIVSDLIPHLAHGKMEHIETGQQHEAGFFFEDHVKEAIAKAMQKSLDMLPTKIKEAAESILKEEHEHDDDGNCLTLENSNDKPTLEDLFKA